MDTHKKTERDIPGHGQWVTRRPLPSVSPPSVCLLNRRLHHCTTTHAQTPRYLLTCHKNTFTFTSCTYKAWHFNHSVWHFNHSLWHFNHSLWHFNHSVWHFNHSLCDISINLCDMLMHFMMNNTLHHHHNCFMALFPGPPGWAGAKRELLDFMVQGKINRGRHTDHPAGRHSIWTNQCPPPPSPISFAGPMPFLPPNQQCQSTEGTEYFPDVV